MKNKYRFIQDLLPYFLLLILVAFPIFGRLDLLPIQHWDEAQLSVNAQEMNRNGQFLVTYYEGEPDFWNTKPPLMIWCQVICYKIFGENELAVRLPSALAALFACFLLLYFSRKYFKSSILGFIAALILVTSWGFVEVHASRTGDYDALVSLFLFSYVLFYYIFLESNKTKYLYLFFLGFVLAVMTKASIGFFFLPALFIYTLFSKKLNLILGSKHTYIGMSISICIIFAYYLGREFVNPGYIKAAWYCDYFGRYAVAQEGHVGPWNFYIKTLVSYQYKYWIMYIPFSVLWGFLSKNQKIKHLTIYLSLCILIFGFIISMSTTKIDWYTTPLFPLFAMLNALFLYSVFVKLKEIKYTLQICKCNILPYLFLIFIFLFPCKAIFMKIYARPVQMTEEYFATSRLLQRSLTGAYNLNNYHIITDKHKSFYWFYVNILNDRGINIGFKAKEHLLPKDKIITQEHSINTYIQEHYNFKIVDEINNVRMYEIIGLK